MRSRKDEVRSWKWEGGSKKEVGKVKDRREVLSRYE